jgi:hypothetical protein
MTGILRVFSLGGQLMTLPTKLSSFIAVSAFAIAFVAASSAVQAEGVAKNTSGLPTYPSETSSTMDAQPRSWNGHQCTHYSSDSNDALAMVEAWYRKALAGAKEAPVNADHQYGPFNLAGTKFTRGVDVVNVYRMQNQKDTSIELFKCQ